jgi:formylglycine-generating enzyme required for sulfatase activity
VHRVQLSPFFLSKYEMTQGQWERLTGAHPSYYTRSKLAPTLTHPVEQVTWNDCRIWLGRSGLEIPTEAQWEYAARGGTHSPWWTGSDQTLLHDPHAANLSDRAARRSGVSWSEFEDWLDDAYATHASVGTFTPNPFGLHEVVGNVWEWCWDGYDEHFYSRSPLLDPVSPPIAGGNLVVRGGGFAYPARLARVSYRHSLSAGASSAFVGVRPARRLDP